MTSRGHHRIDEHTCFESHGRCRKGLFQVAHIERDDRALRVADFETFFFETFQRIVGHFPKRFETLRLLLEDVEGFECTSRRRGGVRRREDIRARRVTQIVDNGVIGRNETTDRSQTLGEGAHNEVHLVGQAEVVTNPSSLTSEDAHAVGLVHHDRRSILLLERDDFGQRRQIAFHREHTVHNDQFHGVGFALLQLVFQVGHVVVLVAQLLSHRQAAAVHDRSVVAVVTEDVVVRSHKRRNHATVHRETGRETERFVFSDELRQFFFELHVQIQCSVEKTTAGTTRSVSAHGGHTGLNHAFVARQTGVGIRTEHDHVVTVHFNFGALLAFDFSEIRIQTLLSHLLRQVILGKAFVKNIHV